MTAMAEFLPRLRLPYVSSTIGRKVVMAVTGLVLFGFVLGHFVGNLTLYLGPEAINAYSRFLHGFLHGGGLWVARLGRNVTGKIARPGPRKLLPIRRRTGG